MENNYIDEVALLKAFIDFGTLTYTEVQERGIVPRLTKHDRRTAFKNAIDKFRRWEIITYIPDSDPKTWRVNLEKAQAEYNKLQKEIEQKQIVEKYSLEHLREAVNYNTKRLRSIYLFKVLAVTGALLGLFTFFTGLSFMQLIALLKNCWHYLAGHN